MPNEQNLQKKQKPRQVSWPLRSVLLTPVEPEDTEKGWQAVRQNLASSSRFSLSSNGRLSSVSRFVGAVAVVALVLVVVRGDPWGAGERSSESSVAELPAVVTRVQAPTPLPVQPKLSDANTALGFSEVTVLPDEPERQLQLPDGSTVVLASGSSLQALSSDGQQVVLLLREGRALFNVNPQSMRRWLIEAKPAQVEVTGTVFSVARQEEETFVEVQRGSVLVRAAQLEHGVRRLGPGETLRVGGEVKRKRPAVTQAIKRYRASQVRGSSGAPKSWPAIMTEVDALRVIGQSSKAAKTLREGLARNRELGIRAAIGHYTLGRIELNELNAPSRAVESFQNALSLPLPEALRSHCESQLLRAKRRIPRETL